MSIPSLSYFALIPHADRPAVLAYANSDGLTLPHITTDDWSKLNVTALSAHVHEALGLEVTALRRVLIHRDGDDLLRTVLLMENHTPDADPCGETCWISMNEVDTITDPLLQEAARRWFSESPVDPPMRTPWAKRGWFIPTKAWVEHQAQQAGYILTAPLHIKRTWSLTCMMVQPTNRGDLYIKATNAMFGPEAELTAQLGKWFPNYVPDVVTYDAAQRLHIMPDIGGTPLGEVRDLAQWTHTAGVFARIQRACVHRVDDLLALGCWDRRPRALIPLIDPLVSDTEVLHVGQPDGLTEDEFAQFQALAPRLKALCEEIESLGIPMTLTHGDFHSGNIVVANDIPIFYDWSDASIGHPFMDMYLIVTEDLPESMPDLSEHVRKAYLGEWAGIVPPDVLERAWALAMPLGMLNQAISYRYIIQHMEPSLRAEMNGATVVYAKALLTHLFPDESA